MTLKHSEEVTIIKGFIIPTNLSKTKSGTKSLKKQDFFCQNRDILKNLMIIAKIIKLREHKNTAKKRDRVKNSGTTVN